MIANMTSSMNIRVPGVVVVAGGVLFHWASMILFVWLLAVGHKGNP